MTRPCPTWQPADHDHDVGAWQRPPDDERARLLEQYEAAQGVRPERVGVREVVMSDGTQWCEWGFR